MKMWLETSLCELPFQIKPKIVLLKEYKTCESYKVIERMELVPYYIAIRTGHCFFQAITHYNVKLIPPFYSVIIITIIVIVVIFIIITWNPQS